MLKKQVVIQPVSESIVLKGIGVLAFSQLLDLLLTWLCFNAGYVELNPFYYIIPLPLFILVKFAGSLILIPATALCLKHGKNYLLLIFCSLIALITIQNIVNARSIILLLL